MVPFTRKLRSRIRRLPKSPDLSHQAIIEEKPIIKDIHPSVPTTEPVVYIDDENLNKFTKDKETTEISNLSEDKLFDNLKSSVGSKKKVLNEIGDLMKEGTVTEGLTKIIPESTVHDDVDYNKVRKSQYARAVDDYRAAGKTFTDSGLFSNASISYTCAVLAKLLATSSIQEGYKEFQNIVEIIQDKQIIRSSVFSILTHLFEALAKKDLEAMTRLTEKLKLIETFSIDDQELINDSVEFLS